MHHKNIITICILLVLSISQALSFNTTQFNQILNKSIQSNGLGSALIGIKVIDTQNKKIIFSKNADKNFTPASNTKLVTASAALLFLGKNFRYKTKLYYDTLSNNTINNLYIDFSGDPSFTSKKLNELLNILKEKHIKQVNNLYFVNRFFEGRNIAMNQSNTSLFFGYGAPSSIYNLNENLITVNIEPKFKNFTVKQISGEPIKIINKLYIADANQLKKCQFNGSTESNIITFSGCLPKNKYIFNFAINNPRKIMELAILKYFTNSRISLKNKIKFSTKLPNKLHLININKSDKLSVLLKHMLVYSDNLYAQTILRTIGYYYNQSGSIISGKNSALEILKTKLNLDTDSIQLEDGDGGSANDLLNPNFLVDLLYKLSKDKNFELFKNFLPLYGKTGTLKNRKGKSLIGKVFAKTGTQTTASALSGYLYINDKEYIFSIFINNLKDNQKAKAINLQKDILENITI